MPRFVIRKVHDAFVYYDTVVEADTSDEAHDLARSVHYNGVWCAIGYVQEFENFVIDDCCGDRQLLDDEYIEAYLTIAVTAQERDAILAGLRLLDLALACGNIDTELENILTNDGTHGGLDFPGIDDLCERINV